MRLLFVGVPESIHMVRVVETLASTGWEIHFFPATNGPPHEEMRNITLYRLADFWRSEAHPSIRVRRWGWFRLPADERRVLESRWFPSLSARATALARVIRRVKPDIVHSHGLDYCAPLTFEARARFRGTFPTWIVSGWGADIHLLTRLPHYAERVRAMLAAADYYVCECHRDVRQARALGYAGEVFPVQPVTGGFDLRRLVELKSPIPPSQRRTIALKGNESLWGRALNALRALERCAELLRGHRLALYLVTSDEVRREAERLCRAYDVDLEVVERVPYEEMLRMHGRARVSIGLGTSDGISMSFLEAIAMGSFPVQSRTGCANEWIQHGETGLLVEPDDVEGVAAAIRRALADDELVDRAADVNARTVAARADREAVAKRLIDAYEHAAAHPRPRQRSRRFTEGRCRAPA